MEDSVDYYLGVFKIDPKVLTIFNKNVDVDRFNELVLDKRIKSSGNPLVTLTALDSELTIVDR